MLEDFMGKVIKFIDGLTYTSGFFVYGSGDGK